MDTIRRRFAYSLSEIMCVMLVLSIIFAAIAPFFTKRRIDTSKSKYAVWELADKNSYDAYSTTNKPEDNGALFWGVKPTSQDEVEAVFSPLAKLVIRSGPVTSANKVQRQIQFRYGYHNDHPNGKFAGSWLMDGRNMLLGGSYPDINITDAPAVQNTAIGFKALNKLKSGRSNTALGYNALQAIENSSYNTAIGSHAGYNSHSNARNNTFIGASAGYSNTGYGNTAIGYNTLGYKTTQATGYYNTFIGTGSGESLTSGNYNLGVGYHALKSVTTGSDNIAVGYNALGNLTTGSYNVAIGYNACLDVTTGSQITCIGANSGPHTGSYKTDYPGIMGYLSTAEAYLKAATSNNTPRTYIGSKPTNFGGDAVLEIHNVPDKSNEKGKSHGIAYFLDNTPSNVTTVINGNLIVRGRPYFTSGQTLYHVHDANYFRKDTQDQRYLGYTKTNKSDVTCTSDISSYTFTGKNCVKWPSSTTSDRRLKNIGSKFTDGLNKLSQVKVYNYTFKNDEKKSPRVGVIAQELEKIFPNAVHKGDDGYLRIRWDELFYAAINAIKELDSKLVALVNKVTKVEPQITKLEEENLVLQTQIDQLSKRINKLKN